jgi:hypothetical protein
VVFSFVGLLNFFLLKKRSKSFDDPHPVIG